MREILGLIKKAFKTELADETTLTDIDISVFFDAYKQKYDKKGMRRKGNGKAFSKMTKDDFLSLPFYLIS